MSTFVLVIGNKNYSSWSLRAWLALKRTGAPFTEIMIPLDQVGTRDAIRAHSPAGKVPVLHHGSRTIWDTLAIGEYLAETFPAAGLWPDDPEARAAARSICSEMHAGFSALRAGMPMNLRKELPEKGRDPGVSDDVARITEIWAGSRRRFGAAGPFLFGDFSLADAMYAPVVGRFRTYAVSLDGPCVAYADAVWNWPDLREWVAAAGDEPYIIEKEER